MDQKETDKKQGIFDRIKRGKKPGKDQFLMIILAGILLIIIALPTSDNPSKKTAKSSILDSGSNTMDITEESPQDSERKEEDKKTETEEYEAYLENKLEQIISVMEGVGKVKVTVTVSASSEKVVEKDIPTERNNTMENDSEGGNRSVNEIDSKEETVYRKDSNGSESPYVVKTIRPPVEGVAVAAQGADRPEVNKNITGVIVALFDIEPHKIKVVKMKSE